MAEKTLGLPFDIHGRGRALTFPHHENEIAQSCCSSADINNPKSYVNYWMHNGFVTVNGEKMSKSLGNISLVKDLTDSNHGEVVRLALLSSHYRQALDWNEKIIHQSKKLLDKLYSLLNELKDVDPVSEIKMSDKFISPLLDDLNTPFGIAFSSDGTKMFVVENSNKSDGTDQTVNEYTLSTGFDITTASFTYSFDYSDFLSPEILPVDIHGVEFSDDGKKMFLMDTKLSSRDGTGKLFEYVLSCPWQLTGECGEEEKQGRRTPNCEGNRACDALGNLHEAEAGDRGDPRDLA